MRATTQSRRPVDDLARAILGVDADPPRLVLTGETTDSGENSEDAQLGAWSNPMTGAGDIIEGAESGSAVRVGIGLENQVLTVVDIGAGELRPRWADPTGGSGGGQYRSLVTVTDGAGGWGFVEVTIDGDTRPATALHDLE